MEAELLNNENAAPKGVNRPRLLSGGAEISQSELLWVSTLGEVGPEVLQMIRSNFKRF